MLPGVPVEHLHPMGVLFISAILGTSIFRIVFASLFSIPNFGLESCAKMIFLNSVR